ncbi:MAG: hypothetical protein U9N46_08075, partial [Euryarchaeota archaeon]|nr:hypothetical protein [Euryarchaeota archaeon]
MMIKRSALLILICIALAHTDTASARDVVWIDVGDATLYKGGTYSYEDFTVEFVDCENKGDLERTHHEEGGDLVLLRLKKGDLVVNESVLNATCANVSSTNICDELIWDDEVKIEIYADTDDYPRSEDPINWQDSCIHIYFHERAKPEISLEIETNCETYTAQDSEISITVDIANDGDADLENLSVAIDSGDLQAIAPLDRRFGNLSVGAEETFRTRLSVPSWITETEGGTFIITVNATGFDERDAMYTESESVEILVLPRFDLKIKKTVNGYISMDQSVWVRIDLENTGKRDLEVKLNDTVPPGFRLCEHTSETRWKFNITPSEALHFSYHIKPELPGVFKMPAATAEFVMGENNISIRSNAPQITVDGAYVIVAKTIHPANVSVGSTVTVT